LEEIDRLFGEGVGREEAEQRRMVCSYVTRLRFKLDVSRAFLTAVRSNFSAQVMQEVGLDKVIEQLLSEFSEG
jgi:hypothetical protein